CAKTPPGVVLLIGGFDYW
nr:immunoglobulin heavy chain junction region [Macaca mulatta]MOY22316.1 immunoglobulin heavy chain junction region [Macaca mulatta]MOY23430.1 immunoglobulin heavy chain junction region [Macaca mulatta]MOY23529.1 immunoglobulin heavy chain junction region [Macaca mulatta]MOY23660.1 immunoglobulin heavy chain junction region [Macaca mulatta]